MIYYIYHIAGIKIGCTSDLIKRMSDQGFTDWEILEEHTDIYEVSNREIQLQKDYGLPVDTIPYWKSVENRPTWTSESTQKGIITKRANGSMANGSDGSGGKASKGSPRRANRKLSWDQICEIRLKWDPTIYGIRNKLAREYNVSPSTISRVANYKINLIE